MCLILNRSPDVVHARTCYSIAVVKRHFSFDVSSPPPHPSTLRNARICRGLRGEWAFSRPRNFFPSNFRLVFATPFSFLSLYIYLSPTKRSPLRWILRTSRGLLSVLLYWAPDLVFYSVVLLICVSFYKRFTCWFVLSLSLYCGICVFVLVLLLTVALLSDHVYKQEQNWV